MTLVLPEPMQEHLKSIKGDRLPDVRDRVMLALFFDAGLRLSEMAGLRMTDVDLDRGTVSVSGKAGHQRLAPFHDETRKLLDRYVRRRAKWVTERHVAPGTRPFLVFMATITYNF